jgi:hypothetical protein
VRKPHSISRRRAAGGRHYGPKQQQPQIAHSAQNHEPPAVPEPVGSAPAAYDKAFTVSPARSSTQPEGDIAYAASSPSITPPQQEQLAPSNNLSVMVTTHNHNSPQQPGPGTHSISRQRTAGGRHCNPKQSLPTAVHRLQTTRRVGCTAARRRHTVGVRQSSLFPVDYSHNTTKLSQSPT